MLIEEQFRALIIAVPAVAALIGSRLSPIYLKPGETFPAGTYQREDTHYEDEDLEDEAIEKPVLAVQLWGFDYVLMKTAMQVLKDTLRTIQPPAPIATIQIIEEKDVFDEKYQHADGIGLPGTRLVCELTVIE